MKSLTGKNRDNLSHTNEKRGVLIAPLLSSLYWTPYFIDYFWSVLSIALQKNMVRGSCVILLAFLVHSLPLHWIAADWIMVYFRSGICRYCLPYQFLHSNQTNKFFLIDELLVISMGFPMTSSAGKPVIFSPAGLTSVMIPLLSKKTVKIPQINYQRSFDIVRRKILF
ncbi:hypothetical protein [Bacillus songklensis]